MGRRRNVLRFCACGHTLYDHPDARKEGKTYPCSVPGCGCAAYIGLYSKSPEYRSIYQRHRRVRMRAKRPLC